MKKNKKDPKPVKHKISGLSDEELLEFYVCEEVYASEGYRGDNPKHYELEDLKKEILERMTPKTFYKNEKR